LKRLAAHCSPMPATAPAGCGIARPIPGARPCGTCLRQSKNAPGVFVAMLYRSIYEGRPHAQSSTVKPGIRQANSLAWRRLNVM